MEKKKDSLTKLKNKSKILITASTCVIMLLIMVAIGTSTSKKTYSATSSYSVSLGNKTYTCSGYGTFQPDDEPCHYYLASDYYNHLDECKAIYDNKLNGDTITKFKSTSEASGILGTFSQYHAVFYKYTGCTEETGSSSTPDTECEAGYYCPSSDTKTQCPANYPYSDAGASHSYDCYKNLTVSAGKQYDVGVLKDCEVGWYCPGGTIKEYAPGGAKANGIIKLCPLGTTNNITNAKSTSDCNTCSNTSHVKEWESYGNCAIKTCDTGYEKKGDYCVATGSTGKVDKPSCKNATYNGAEQTLLPNNAGYTVTYTKGGSTATPKDAGSYTAKATLKSGYTWSDGSTGIVERTCTISKYTPTISATSKQEIEKGSSDSMTTYVSTIKGCSGTLSLTKGNSNIALSNASSTITGTSTETHVIGSAVSISGSTKGTSSITRKFTPSDTANCNGASDTVQVEVKDENKYCTINLTAPGQVDPSSSFDVTAAVIFKPDVHAATDGYTWQCGGLGYYSKTKISNEKINVTASNQEHGYTITCTLTVTTNAKEASCSKSTTINVGDPNYDSQKVTITFKKGSTTLESQTVSLGGTIEFPGVDDYSALKSYTENGKTMSFTGWGASSGCTTGTYSANSTLSNVSTSTTYYACFNEIKETVSEGFELKNCNFTQWIKVESDKRYIGCQRSNITYSFKNTNSVIVNENTRGNLKKCCIDSGYTWVGENYTAASGGEYCIKCGTGTGGGDVTTCDDSGNGKYSTEALARQNGEAACASGVNTIEIENGCYKYTCNGENPDYPSNNDPSSPSSSSKVKPSGSTNIIVNPPTGSALIYIVWAIGFAVIGYAIWYFTTTKNNE